MHFATAGALKTGLGGGHPSFAGAGVALVAKNTGGRMILWTVVNSPLPAAFAALGGIVGNNARSVATVALGAEDATGRMGLWAAMHLARTVALITGAGRLHVHGQGGEEKKEETNASEVFFHKSIDRRR
jgi:hypothetical protein